MTLFYHFYDVPIYIGYNICMTHELESSIITKRLLSIHGTIEPRINRKAIVPPLPDIESIQTLFSLEEVWTMVGNTAYVPRLLIEELIVRMDGMEKQQNKFTAFLADRQQMLKDRLFVQPASVTPKQRYQFYETEYLIALIGSIDDFENYMYKSTKFKAPLYNFQNCYEIIREISATELLDKYNDFYVSLDHAASR